MTAENAMFGKRWWARPLAARYASLDAHAAGLSVSVEMVMTSHYYEKLPCIVWRGTAEQFAATSALCEVTMPKSNAGKYLALRYLRGRIAPNGPGHYEFVIEGCHSGAKSTREHAAVARADERYLDFRDRLMTGYPLSNLEA